MKNSPQPTEMESQEPEFKPLTAQEADQWRKRNPPTSMWRLLGAQCAVGALAALFAWLVTGQSAVVRSAAYGALAVVVPATVFVLGMSRRNSRGHVRAGMFSFAVWELVKILLSVGMLLAAPRLLVDVNWLALVAAMVVTLKTYWVALLVRSGARKTD
jgi:ATP synthase protein I